MALRDQPYLPLYIQDYLTDEKLNECSASTQGIYIKIMCLMHKSETYGKILLKQKYKQKESTCLSFALQLAKHLPFSKDELSKAINELLNENVCYFHDGFLCQKRMIKDNDLSLKRAEAGKKGGNNSKFAQAKSKANIQANSENEYENENENINEDINTIYSLYPSKCPIKNSSTGKTKTNKNKIGKLLKEYSKDELVSKINWYIEDCKKHKVFIKNFSTFLNNLPDDGLYIVDDSMKTFTLSCFGHLSKIKANTLEEAKEIFSKNNGIIPHDQIKVG